MPTESKSKKSSPTVNETQISDAQPNPDGFLAELNEWGTKPNPASFEKLLETNQEKFARALSQGYSVEDICRLAASYGIQVKASTFRKYWQKLNAKLPSELTPAATSKQPTTKSSTKPDSTASTNANSAVNF
jgi:hypothetical protein